MATTLYWVTVLYVSWYQDTHKAVKLCGAAVSFTNGAKKARRAQSCTRFQRLLWSTDCGRFRFEDNVVHNFP